MGERGKSSAVRCINTPAWKRQLGGIERRSCITSSYTPLNMYCELPLHCTQIFSIPCNYIEILVCPILLAEGYYSGLFSRTWLEVAVDSTSLMVELKV